MTINPVESFLLLTPSRIYLKVIGYYCVLDGKRWEEFIQVDLPHLNKFEFFISSWTSTAQTRDDLQLIIQSFQTPFWIEYKKWFVACEFHLKKPRQIQIYSIPICKTIFHDRLDSEKCFLSASNDLSITKNINEIYLKLDNPHDNNILKRINTPFPNATKVRLDFPRDISKDLTHYLRSIFNVSQLTEVHLKYDSFYNCNKDLLFDLIKLIESSSKLTSLTIYSHICKSSIYPFLNDLCWLLPHQIKYLQIPVTKLEQVEIIFQRCHYLSVVKFETKGSERTAKIAEWFEENTIDSIFRRYNGYDCIWIGKKLNQINENPKRIKLMNK